MIRNCKPDMPETVFGSLVNPIPTRGPGADGAHHITAAPSPQNFGRCGISASSCQYPLMNYLDDFLFAMPCLLFVLRLVGLPVT